MNIGIDATMLQPARTGVGNYVFNLLRHYRALRPRSSLFLFSNDRVSDDARWLGECIEDVLCPVRKGPLWMSTGLPPLLRKYAIDVFWGGNGYLPLVVPRGTRRVVTIHDFVYLHAGHTLPRISLWSRRVLQPLAIRQADALLSVSRATDTELRSRYGRTSDAILEPPIDPIYRPAAIDEIASVRRRYELPERFLLTIGTLEPRKNIAGLLRAYVRARDAGADLPPLVIAGKLGWLTTDIQATIDVASRRWSARFLEYVPLELMPALYSAAEAFIFVPLYEGYGMPAREALQCGTPVIASDIAALREATQGCARLVSPDERALESLFHDYASSGPPPRPTWTGTNDAEIVGAIERFATLLEHRSA